MTEHLQPQPPSATDVESTTTDVESTTTDVESATDVESTTTDVESATDVESTTTDVESDGWAPDGTCDVRDIRGLTDRDGIVPFGNFWHVMPAVVGATESRSMGSGYRTYCGLTTTAMVTTTAYGREHFHGTIGRLHRDHACSTCFAMLASTSSTSSTSSTFPDDVPIGTGAVDVERGHRANSALFDHQPRRFPDDVTVRDMLASLNARADEIDTVVRNISRTLRAYGRNQYSERRQFLSTYQQLIDDGTLSHPFWRYDTTDTGEMPIGASNDVDPSRVLNVIRRAPDRPGDTYHGATVRDIAAAWHGVEHVAHDDISALSEALDEASSEHGWCPVYDRLCEDLNEHLPARWGEMFVRTDREVDWMIDGMATVSVVVQVPWSTIISATTADQASEMVSWDHVELDEFDYVIRHRQALPEYVRIVSHEIDDYDVNEVTRYD